MAGVGRGYGAARRASLISAFLLVIRALDRASIVACPRPGHCCDDELTRRAALLEAVFFPALQHQRLVLGRGATVGGKRSLLHSGRRVKLQQRVASISIAVPDAGAELRHVAFLERRAGVERASRTCRERCTMPPCARVDAVGERPVDLLVVGRIDVVLEHEHVLVAVLPGAVPP